MVWCASFLITKSTTFYLNCSHIPCDWNYIFSSIFPVIKIIFFTHLASWYKIENIHIWLGPALSRMYKQSGLNPTPHQIHSQKKWLTPLYIIISVSLLSIFNWAGWLNTGKTQVFKCAWPKWFNGLDITSVPCVNAAHSVDFPFTGLECQVSPQS